MNPNHKFRKLETKSILRVGVIGHRFLVEKEKLIQAVDQALTALLETFSARDLAVISSLAEGSDRLVARRIMDQKGALLWVPLPLPRGDYLKDFSSPESRDDFRKLLNRADHVIQLPEAPDRNRAYVQSGGYILDYCDVLIAVWDGKEAQNQGGTGDFVAEARRRGLPLVWIHAGNRMPGTEIPTSLGEEQGKVTYLNWPENSSYSADQAVQEK